MAVKNSQKREGGHNLGNRQVHLHEKLTFLRASKNGTKAEHCRKNQKNDYALKILELPDFSYTYMLKR